jgi:hypothetical protein
MSLDYTTKMTFYLNTASIENVYNNYKKIVGIECNKELINEHNKNIGKVILLFNVKKFKLGDYIEFDMEKKKYVCSNIDSDNNGCYYFDPYWLKLYRPEPFIDVQIKIYKPKTDSFEYEIKNMNLNMFIKERMLEHTGEYNHRLIMAVENYNLLRYKYNTHIYSLNATIKNYHIKKGILKLALSKFGGHKAAIINEWNKLLAKHYQNNAAANKINQMFNNKKTADKSKNVVKFKKVS